MEILLWLFYIPMIAIIVFALIAICVAFLGN